MDNKNSNDELIDDLDSEQELPVEETAQNDLKVAEKTADGTMHNMESVAYNQIETNLSNGKADLNEAAKQLVDVATTARAVNTTDTENDSFLKDIKDIKQDELKVRAQRLKLAEDTAKIEAKKANAEAMFNFFRPILEMDFSNLIPDKDKEEQIKKQKISYSDRSYGIPLMCIMLIFFTPIYFAFSAILAIMNGVNAIFLALQKFSKCAMIICFALFIMALISLVIYIILLILQTNFGIIIFA
jgi:hypothetical protein